MRKIEDCEMSSPFIVNKIITRHIRLERGFGNDGGLNFGHVEFELYDIEEKL